MDDVEQHRLFVRWVGDIETNPLPIGRPLDVEQTLQGSGDAVGIAAIGIGLMLGVLGRIDLKINFMNFVALPITLGVGADYAANIWARLRRERGHLTSVIADTGISVWRYVARV